MILVLRETNLNSTLNHITKVHKDLNSISNSISEKLNNQHKNQYKDNELLSGVNRDSLSIQASQHKILPNTIEHSIIKRHEFQCFTY